MISSKKKHSDEIANPRNSTMDVVGFFFSSMILYQTEMTTGKDTFLDTTASFQTYETGDNSSHRRNNSPTDGKLAIKTKLILIKD